MTSRKAKEKSKASAILHCLFKKNFAEQRLKYKFNMENIKCIQKTLQNWSRKFTNTDYRQTNLSASSLVSNG